MGSGNGLVLDGQQAITQTNTDPVYQRTYAASVGDELKLQQHL